MDIRFRLKSCVLGTFRSEIILSDDTEYSFFFIFEILEKKFLDII